MRIRQEDNGNIVIMKTDGEILHILPSMYIHQHPRKKNAILITNSPTYMNEHLGISILASAVKDIGGENFNGDVKSLKSALSKRIVVSGNVLPPKEDPQPLRKENDPRYVEYLLANTFEKMLVFAKEHNIYSGDGVWRDGKLVQEEFFCQFTTFTIRVTLNYFYREDKPNLIRYISMFGSTGHVHKTKKVYLYDNEDNLTGFRYEEKY